MSDTITFTGVQLQSFGRKVGSGHASYVANYPTKKVCDEMGWGPMVPGQVSAKMEGSIHATSMVLVPSEKGLAKHKVNFDITSLSGFQGFRLEMEGHKGKGHRLEFRFNMGFVAKDACKELEQFMLTCGNVKSTLTVSYVKQSQLDLEAASEAENEGDENEGDDE